jgi:hypothetical protein
MKRHYSGFKIEMQLESVIKNSVYNGKPIHNVLLTGYKLSFEGFTEEETQKLRGVTHSLGATYFPEFKSQLSCLIVKKIGGPLSARCYIETIPVVKVQWLLDCSKQKKYLSFDDYFAGAFQGLVISCTGYELEERRLLKKVVEEEGGIFSKDLKRGETTHLVCAKAEGAKYSTALLWGDVFVVNQQWIEVCLRVKSKCFFDYNNNNNNNNYYYYYNDRMGV